MLQLLMNRRCNFKTKMANKEEIRFGLVIAISVSAVLSMVQLKVERPMILLRRFIEGSGWFEIVVISIYAAISGIMMSRPGQQAKWRIRTWTIFSVVFFFQLLLGLAGFEKFLMTGKLHLPIPMMIVAGPVFRSEISFMPVLFLSTIVLSGPAWCSQLCYFGAFDGLAASSRKPTRLNIKILLRLKIPGLFMIISSAILLRLLGVSTIYTTIIAGLFGIVGILVIAFLSLRKGKMIQCMLYCPVGTLVNYIKYINPFRFRIADSCTSCMKCLPVCRYGALTAEDIKKGKPGRTCTYCGDCMPVCKPGSFYYKFPGLGASASRYLWIGLTISLHAIFLALARI